MKKLGRDKIEQSNHDAEVDTSPLQKVSPQYLVVVECAIEYNGKFLIIRRPEGVHAGGLLAFPGGNVDYHDGQNQEDLIANDILARAAKREVLEEVGLDLIDPIKFVRSSYFNDKYGKHVIDAIYYCKIEKTPLTIKASAREVPEYFWMTPQEIEAHEKSPPWLKHYIMDIKKMCMT